MKKITLILFLFAICSHSVFSQGNGKNREKEENEAMQQIRTSGMADILSFQTQNRDVSNLVLTQQIGDQNKASVNQQTEAGFGNQSYSIQQGTSNEMTIGQIGSGNLLLGFQLGYVTSELGRQQGNHYGFGLENGIGNAYAYGHGSSDANSVVEGERNKLAITQEGTNNSVISVQQGSDNTISAEQKGTNNYLLLLQKGKNNSITGYSQENTSDRVLFETVIQEGEGLSLNTTDVSKSKPNGNTFIQSGVNLSLQVNNAFANTLGGIEINQTGRDMKVVVDQSFFSFPMK